ncbi:MAG: hypothetical protein AAF799_29720 [Myxococcota bacterium]
MRRCLPFIAIVLAGTACGPSSGNPEGLQGEYTVSEEIVEDPCGVAANWMELSDNLVLNRDTDGLLLVPLPVTPSLRTDVRWIGRTFMREVFNETDEGLYTSMLSLPTSCGASDDPLDWHLEAEMEPVEDGVVVTLYERWDMPAGCRSPDEVEPMACELDRVLDYTQTWSCADDCRIEFPDGSPAGPPECVCG